ncbi:hypothetical protein SLE2022_268310 [Rubroshorea leprosula]
MTITIPDAILRSNRRRKVHGDPVRSHRNGLKCGFWIFKQMHRHGCLRRIELSFPRFFTSIVNGLFLMFHYDDCLFCSSVLICDLHV